MWSENEVRNVSARLVWRGDTVEAASTVSSSSYGNWNYNPNVTAAGVVRFLQVNVWMESTIPENAGLLGQDEMDTTLNSLGIFKVSMSAETAPQRASDRGWEVIISVHSGEDDAFGNASMHHPIAVLPDVVSRESSKLVCSTGFENIEWMANVQCGVTLFDRFGNHPASTDIAMSQVVPFVRVDAYGTEMAIPVNVSDLYTHEHSQEENVFMFSFAVPRVRRTVRASVTINGQPSTTSSLTSTFVPTPTKAVDVKEIDCPVEITAGDNVQCALQLADKYGLPIGRGDISLQDHIFWYGHAHRPKTVMEQNITMSLLATVESANLTQATVAEEGIYTVTFRRLHAAGVYNISLGFRASGERPLSGAYSITKVVAGPVSARQSRVSCPSRVEWSDHVRCVVTLVDAYWNPSDAFLFGTLQAGYDRSINYNALTISTIEGGGNSAGRYNVTYAVPRVRGMLNVTIYVEGNVVADPGIMAPLLVGGQSASSQIVVTSVVQAGKLSCPASVVAGESFGCHVVLHDKHGLPVGRADSFSDSRNGRFSAAEVAIVRENPDQIIQVLAKADLHFDASRHNEGEFEVRFLPGFVTKIVADPKKYAIVYPSGSLREVQRMFRLIPAAPSLNYSTFTCRSATALQLRPVTCDVGLHDAYGNPTNASEGLSVTLGGVAANSVSQPVVYSRGSANVVTFLAPNELGDATIKVELYGRAINKTKSILIEPAPIYGPLTKLDCDPSAEAGVSFSCRVSTFSAAGTPTGRRDSFEGFKGLRIKRVTGGYTGVAVNLEPDEKIGVYKARVVIPSAGIFVAIIQDDRDGRNISASTALSPTHVEPGMISPNHSHFHCPDAAPLSVPLTCALHANDRFGNPTSTLSLASFAVDGDDMARVQPNAGLSVGEYELVLLMPDEPSDVSVKLSYFTDEGYVLLGEALYPRRSERIVFDEKLVASTIVSGEQISFTVTYNGTGWFAIGVSRDGTMTSSGQGSDVIGCDDSGVHRYFVTARSKQGLGEGRAVPGATCEIRGGARVMRFNRSLHATSGTELAVRSGDNGETVLIYAYGADANMTSYHESRGTKRANLAAVLENNPQTIAVELTQLNMTASTIDCTPKKAVAGQEVTCAIRAYVRGAKQEGVAAPGLGQFLLASFAPYKFKSMAAKTDYDGVPGHYTMRFTPTKSGAVDVRFEYNNIALLESGAQRVQISAANVDPKSSRVACGPGSVEAGGTVRCIVQTYDEFKNPAHDVSSLQDFMLFTEHEATTASAGSFAETRGAVALGTRYAINTPSLERAGPYRLVVVYDNVSIPVTGENAIMPEADLTNALGATDVVQPTAARIVVVATYPSMDTSSFDCPPVVPYLAPSFCSVSLRDRFSNTFAATADMIARFSSRINATHSETGQPIELRVATFTLDVAGSVSAAFRVVDLVTQISVRVDFAGFGQSGDKVSQIGHAMDVTIQRIALDVERSSLSCTARSGAVNDAVVAGTPIDCLVQAVEKGTGQPVLAAGFAGAFQAAVFSEGIALPMDALPTFDAASGAYNFSFTPTLRGNVHVKVSYAQDSASVVSIGNADSAPMEFTIVPADIDPSSSSVDCFDATLIAGAQFSCEVRTRDRYGNRAGTATSAFLFNTRATIPGRDAARSFGTIFVEEGVFETSALSLNYVGDWFVSVEVYIGGVTSAVGSANSKAQIVTVGRGEYSTANSTFVCETTAPSAAFGACLLTTRDRLGNLALASTDMADNVSVEAYNFKDGSTAFAKRVSLTGSDGAAGVYSVLVPTPALATVLRVTLSLWDQSADEFITLSSRNVTVVQTQLSNTSKATCQDAVVAGQSFTCLLLAKEYGSNAPITISSLAAAFVLKISQRRGSNTQTSYAPVTYVGPGKFSANFVPSRAGADSVISSTFLYQAETTYPVGGENLRTTVAPAAPVMAQSILFCPDSVAAPDAFLCTLTLRDVFSNAIDANSDMALGISGEAVYIGLTASTSAVATATATATATASTNGAREARVASTTVEFVKDYATSLDGQFRVYLPQLKHAGFWSITVSLPGTAIDGLSSRSLVSVQAGKADGSQSYFSAPLAAPSSASVQLDIFVRDRFGNPTLVIDPTDMNPAGVSVSGLRLRVSPYQPYQVFEQVSAAESSETTANFFAVVATPALAGSVDVSISLGREATPLSNQTKAGSLSTVQIIQTALDKSGTTAECFSSSATQQVDGVVSVRAGDEIVCILTALDDKGVKIAQKELAPAFSLMSQVTAAPAFVSKVIYTGVAGKFTASFQLKRAGDSSVQFFYDSSDGNKGVGPKISISVTAGEFSAERSSMRCSKSVASADASDPVAGPLVCTVTCVDRFANRLTDAGLIAGVIRGFVGSAKCMACGKAVQKRHSNVIASEDTSSGEVSVVFATGALVVSGQWNVTVTSGPVVIGWSELIVNAGAFSPTISTAVCDLQAPLLASGSCRVIPRDAHGNALNGTRTLAGEFYAKFSNASLAYEVRVDSHSNAFHHTLFLSYSTDVSVLVKDIAVSVFHRSADTGVDTRMVNNAKVSILAKGVDAKQSRVRCAPSTIRAGDKTTCAVSAVDDENGEPLAAAALAQAFDLSLYESSAVRVAGVMGVLRSQQTSQYRQGSRDYAATFAPRMAGVVDVYAKYSAGLKSVTVGLGENPEQLVVLPGDVDTSTSSFLCQQQGIVNKELRCRVQLSDAYANAIPVSSEIVERFPVRAVLQTSTANNAETVVVTATPASSAYAGESGFEMVFNGLLIAGNWTVETQLVSATGSIEWTTIGGFATTPGFANATNSELLCPEKVVTGSQLQCLLTIRDTFGNLLPSWNSFYIDDVLQRFRVKNSRDSAEFFSYGRIIANGDGSQVANFLVVAQVESGTEHSIALELALSATGSSSSSNSLLSAFVQAVPVSVDAARSVVRCMSAGRTDVVAGSTSVCEITPVKSGVLGTDETLEQAPGAIVRERALEDSFRCRATAASGERVKARTEFIPGGGDSASYRCLFETKLVGEIRVEAEYWTSPTVFSVLGDPSQPSSQSSFSVVPAPISQGKMSCVSQAGVMAPTVCELNTIDQFGNPAGEKTEESRLFVRAYHMTADGRVVQADSSTSDAEHGGTLWQDGVTGLFTQPITLTSAGTWDLDLVMFDESGGVENILASSRAEILPTVASQEVVVPGTASGATEAAVQTISIVPKLTVAPGPLESSKSSFTCGKVGTTALTSAEHVCHINARDMFDNAVQTTLEEALSAFIVSVEASQSTNQRFAPRLVNQTDGIYRVGFYTPKLPQDVKISVKHASGTNIESTRGRAEVDTPVTVETITVKTIELDNERTRIVCPTEVTEAGTTVSCLLTLFNYAGEPVTEPSMAAVLHGQTFLAGTKPSTRITHRFNNEFIVAFTPTEIPSPNGRATATLDVHKLEAGGLTSAVGTPQKIPCTSATPRPERSRVVRCAAGTAGVAATVLCEVATFDDFGNPAGTPNIARGLRFEARLLGTATSFKSELSVPLDVDTPGAFNNRFELSATITQAGIWDVSVYHDNLLVQGSSVAAAGAVVADDATPSTLGVEATETDAAVVFLSAGVHRVAVLSGPAVASQSTLNCADDIICGGLATCVLDAKDAFGNPTIFTAGDVRSFYHEFRPSNVIRTSTAKLSIDRLTNVTTLTFQAPDKERGDISVTSSYKGSVLGVANNISSSLRNLSATKSSVHCSRDRAGHKDGGGPALVAGESVNCVLTAISGEDEKTEVNDPAMVHAFHVTVSDNGRQTIVPSTDITPVGRGGQFTFKASVARAGTMSIVAEYEKSGARIRLRGNTKSYPDAQHDLAGAVENKVVGAKIYPPATKTSCSADANLGVLDDVECIFETFDEFGNIVGDDEDASAMFAIASLATGWPGSINSPYAFRRTVYPEVAGVTSTGQPLYAAKEAQGVGRFRTRLKIRRAGQWSIALLVQRETVASATVNLVPGPLAPQAAFSSLECNSDAPAGTRVSCELLAYDAYGNAALTSAAMGRALSLSIAPRLAEGYQDMIQPSTRRIGVYVVSFKTPQLSTRISVSLSAPLSIGGNSSSTAGGYVNVGSTAQIAVRGTVLQNTSKLECSPLEVEAGGTVSCMIYATEKSTGQPTGEALKNAFSWIHAASETEIVRPEFISAVRFVTAGVYAFDVTPRVVTKSGDGDNGRTISGLRVSAVYYNGGPESYMQLGSENEIQIVAGPVSAAQSDVECDQVVRLPDKITCRVLVFDAFNNPVGSASFVDAFSATSTHAMMGLSHRSSAANTTVSLRENRGQNLAEYTLSIPVTKASEGTNHFWETVVSFGSEVVGKLGSGRGSLHSTNVLSGPLSPKDCQLLCQKDTPAMVPVVCLLKMFDTFGNPVDAGSGLDLENVDTVFEHPDEDILRNLLPNIVQAPFDFDESSVGGNAQIRALGDSFTNNRLLMTFTAPPTKTSLGVMLRLLSRSAADPPIAFDSGQSLTVNVTQAIALSSDDSSLECQASINLVTVAGAPIVCIISAVSEGGDYIGTSALSDAFAVSARSSSGEEVFVTPVRYSGFFGDFVFQVRPEVSTGTTGGLSIHATYTTGEDDPVVIKSPDAGTSFDTTRLTVIPAPPSQASLECDDSAAVGGAVCIAKTNDAYGNPSGSMYILPLIYVRCTHALSNDAIGSYASQWQAEGEFQLSLPGLRTAGVWQASLDLRPLDISSPPLQQITILPGPWDPTRSSFSCPKSAMTNAKITCSLSLRDVYDNPVPATTAHTARILIQVVGMPGDAPVLSGVSLPTGAGSSMSSVNVIVGAPAGPVTGLQIFLFDAQTWMVVGRPALVDVSRTELSPAKTKTRCRGENIDGTLPQAGTPVFCEVWPVDVNNNPITDAVFADSLSIWTSQRGASQTAFQQKEQGQFWATFTPTRAMAVRVRLLMTEQISGRDKVTLLNGGADRQISVSVVAGPPLMAKSKLRCTNSLRVGAAVSAGDNVDCVLRLVDTFGNRILDKQVARDLSLRVLTAESGLLLSSGRVDFEYVRKNYFRATVPVTQAGNLVFQVTSTIGSTGGGDNAEDTENSMQVKLSVGPGTASGAASKFLCPARLERLGLDKFSCYVFLFDSYGNPLAHPLLTPKTFSSKSTRSYGRQVHVNFEAGADKRSASYRVRYSPIESDDLLSMFDSVRAQFMVELSTDPTSKTSLNATELVISAHIRNEVIGGAGSVARSSIVATSEETLNAYSAVIKYKFHERSLVVGKRVRATMYIRKTDSMGELKTVKMPSLAALLVGSVQNRQAVSPPVAVRAISNRFDISFTPTASGAFALFNLSDLALFEKGNHRAESAERAPRQNQSWTFHRSHAHYNRGRED